MNREILNAWVHFALLNPIDDHQLAHAKATKELLEENARYREALEKISCPTSMWDGFNAKMYWDIAHEALKGGE